MWTGTRTPRGQMPAADSAEAVSEETAPAPEGDGTSAKRELQIRWRARVRARTEAGGCALLLISCSVTVAKPVGLKSTGADRGRNGSEPPIRRCLFGRCGGSLLLFSLCNTITSYQ